jgi:hypothetical protein
MHQELLTDLFIILKSNNMLTNNLGYPQIGAATEN